MNGFTFTTVGIGLFYHKHGRRFYYNSEVDTVPLTYALPISVSPVGASYVIEGKVEDFGIPPHNERIELYEHFIWTVHELYMNCTWTVHELYVLLFKILKRSTCNIFIYDRTVCVQFVLRLCLVLGIAKTLRLTVDVQCMYSLCTVHSQPRLF